MRECQKGAGGPQTGTGGAVVPTRARPCIRLTQSRGSRAREVSSGFARLRRRRQAARGARSGIAEHFLADRRPDAPHELVRLAPEVGAASGQRLLSMMDGGGDRCASPGDRPIPLSSAAPHRAQGFCGAAGLECAVQSPPAQAPRLQRPSAARPQRGGSGARGPSRRPTAPPSTATRAAPRCPTPRTTTGPTSAHDPLFRSRASARSASHFSSTAT